MRQTTLPPLTRSELWVRETSVETGRVVRMIPAREVAYLPLLSAIARGEAAP